MIRLITASIVAAVWTMALGAAAGFVALWWKFTHRKVTA